MKLQNRPPLKLAILLLVIGVALVGCGRNRAKESAALPSATVPLRATAITAPAEPVDAVKILVDQAGLVQVTAGQLQAAGFDPQALSTGQLSLTLEGQPVAFTTGSGPDGPELTFYGRPRESRYGRDNVYWLRQGLPAASGGAPTGRTVSAVGSGEPSGSFSDRLRLEENLQYLSQTPAGTDPWVGPTIFAPGKITTTFDLPGWTGDDAYLDVSLWANSEGPDTPDHHVVLHLNGESVADVTWDGKGWRSITATVQADTLQSSGNTLVVDSPGDTPALADVVYLDRVDVDYPRGLEAQDGRLEFTAEAGQLVRVAGLPSDLLLWDITDPARPEPLTGFDAGEAGLQFVDAHANGLRSYAVAAGEARLAPKAILPAAGKDLRENPEGADYIAVVHPDFVEALQPLVELRRSQGLRVAVASIDDVYDTFSHGLPDPAAIRDFLIYARDHWQGPAPRFLLLVGDASYDYHGNVAGGTPNFVPTYLLHTFFVGETASDNWFVNLDDTDDKPEMAVGRIPARTAEQVATVVAKTLAYEREAAANASSSRALFVADDKQSDFQSISDTLANDFLPDSYEVEKVYLGQVEDPNDEIVKSLRDGVGLLTYVGHGSMNVWGKEKMLHIDDVDKLDNESLPFMMTMTCLVGYFHHPTASSMGEELLFKPDGGIVGGLVPTSETLASDQSELAENVYTYLFGDAATVGEAIMLGKRDLAAEHDVMQDLIETFTLLGDPALKLHRPG